MRSSTKWIAIMTVVCTSVGLFLLFQAQTTAFFNPMGLWGIERQYIYAIGLLFLGGLFGLISFLRFLRSRTLLGGIVVTTILTSAAFYVAGKFLYAFPMGAMTNPSGTMTNGQTMTYGNRFSYNIGTNFTINLAQIGLFAIWLLTMALLIYFQTKPVARIQRALESIVEGDSCQSFKIGKSKQFKKIENELSIISATICQHQIMQAKKMEGTKEVKKVAKPKKTQKAKKTQK